VSKYKSLLIVLFICVILQLISASLVKLLFDTSLGVVWFSFFSHMLWIPVAVWIFIDSKRTLFLPWLWALLILFMHLHGVIIYLLVQLLSQNKKSNADT